MAYKTTKATAALTGLSERELRRGYYAGIYPGLAIGEKGGRLRFDPEEVLKTIRTWIKCSETESWKQQIKAV